MDTSDTSTVRTGGFWSLVKPGRSRFVRQVMMLGSGAAFSQILAVAATPLLTRLYDPQLFGIFGLFLSVTMAVSCLATWDYQYAIVVADDQQEAMDLFALCMMIVAVMSLLATGVVLVASDQIAQWVHAPALSSLLYLSPLLLASIGCYNVLNLWATRQERFGRLALSRMGQSGTMLSVQIPAGFAGVGPAGLIVGHIVGQAMAAVVLGYQAWRDDFRHSPLRPNWRRLLERARRHMDFARFGAPRALLASSSTKIAPIVLAAFFGPVVAGYYWLTVKVMQMPVNLVGNSVRQVFFQHASATHRDGGNVLRLFVRTLGAMLGIGLIPAGVLIVGGPTLFAWVFGEQWAQAGVYARWLAAWWMLEFANVPAIKLIPVFGLQKWHLVFEVVALILRTAMIVLGSLLGSALLAVALFSMAGVVTNTILIAFVWVVCLKHARHMPANDLPNHGVPASQDTQP